MCELGRDDLLGSELAPELSGLVRLSWEAFAVAMGILDCQLHPCSAEEETEARWPWEKWLLGMPEQWA